MANISEIEGINSANADKLEANGVKTVEALLETGGTKKGRESLAEATGIAVGLILTWTNHADLMRIKGIGKQFSELLEAAGVDTVPELAGRVPANLAKKLSEINDAKNLSNRTPSESELEDWVAQAKKLPKAVHH